MPKHLFNCFFDTYALSAGLKAEQTVRFWDKASTNSNIRFYTLYCIFTFNRINL